MGPGFLDGLGTFLLVVVILCVALGIGLSALVMWIF